MVNINFIYQQKKKKFFSFQKAKIRRTKKIKRIIRTSEIS